MSLLFPAMLAGLLALGVPVVIHLIARHRYQVQDFPSLRLLRADERTNVFALRLVDLGQLLLRLLVLLLLVLAMARLFAPWASRRAAPRNLVVVVDCSASMRMLASDPAGGQNAPLIELAKATARGLLADTVAPSQCALLAAGEDAARLTPLEPSPSRALEAVEGIEPTDGAGSGLVRAIARACDLVRGRREARSHVVVLTDLRAGAFAARNDRDLQRIAQARRDLGRSLDLVFVDLARGVTENLAIVDAHVRGGEAKVGDDAHVVARVVNYGEKERTAKVRLAVGKRREPAAKDVVLGPHGVAAVDLTTRVSRADQSFVQVEAEAHGEDPMPHDNAFRLPLRVAEARRVLIVHETAAPTGGTPAPDLSRLGGDNGKAPSEMEATLDGAKILRFVLNPGRELGRAAGTGIATTVIAPEALAAQPLSKYDVVVLYDVSVLPEPVLKDLDTFARQGRALVHVASGGVNAMRFNRTFAAAGPGHGVLSPAELGNDRVLDPPAGIAPLDEPPPTPSSEPAIRHSSFVIRHSVHPLLAPFRDRLKGDLSVVRFAKVREVRNPAKGASVLFTATGGLPLALELPVERGRVVLLTFGIELDRGTLARTRVFPALMWRLVDYLTGRLRAAPPDVLVAHRPAILDVSEPAFAFAKELELAGAEGAERAGAGAPRALPISESQTCLIEGLRAGNYLLQKAPPAAETSRAAGAAPPARIGHARLLSANADPRESDTTRIGNEELAELFGDAARVVDPSAAADQVVRGAELWTPLVLLLVLAYAAEGIIGWVRSARRERERAK